MTEAELLAAEQASANLNISLLILGLAIIAGIFLFLRWQNTHKARDGKSVPSDKHEDGHKEKDDHPTPEAKKDDAHGHGAHDAHGHDGHHKAPEKTSKKSVWSSVRPWDMAIAVVIGLVAVAAVAVLYNLHVFDGLLGEVGRRWRPGFGFAVAVVLLIAAFIYFKGGLIRTLLIVAAVALFLINYPQVFDKITRTVDQGVNCFSNSDCGPSIYDIPVVSGNTVNVPRGGSVRVHVVGNAAFRGTLGYCLDFVDRQEHEVKRIEGTRMHLFTPDEGEATVQVNSLPAELCPS